MTYIDVQYTLGTSKQPQLTSLQSTAFDETNHIHFPDGILRTIPCWDYANLDQYDFEGACRTIYGAYTDNYYYFFGTHSRLYVNKNGTLTNITPLKTSTVAAANSLATVDTTNVVTLTKSSHGLSDGDRVKISGAATTNGIPAGDINIEHIITYVDANSFSFTTATDATSTGSGGGGASTVYYEPIAAGFIDQSLGYGYGGGNYGVGNYSVSKTFSNVFQYPRIWSIDRFGNDFRICVGDYDTSSVQSVFAWDGDTAVAPVYLTNSPTDTNFIFESGNALIALKGRRVYASKIGDSTDWTPAADSSAYFDDLEGVNRLVSGIKARGTNLLFSEDVTLTFSYIGEPNYWRAQDLLTVDGIIAPNARAYQDETVFWMGKRGFYSFDGSSVQRLINMQNEDWIFDNLNYGQRYKIFCRTDVANKQIWWFFPIDNEPDNYVIYNYANGSWTLGTRDLTAAQQPASLNNIYYTANAINSTGDNQVIWRDDLESGQDLDWIARTSYSYGSTGMTRMRLRDFLPDVYTSDNYNVRVLTKEWANSTAYASGYYTATPTTQHISLNAAGKLRAIEWSGTKPITIGQWREDIIIQGKT